MTENEEQLLFLRYIGSAIGFWSNVERAVGGCAIFSLMKTDEDFDPLASGFYAIENFRSKLAFADKVVSKKIVGTQHVNDWTTLLERAKNLSSIRNKIAHNQIREFPEGKAGRRILLCPWVFQIERAQAGQERVPAGSLGLLDVVRACLDFEALGCSLANFSCRINGNPEHFPKSSEQAGDLPTIQSLLRQIHTALGHPQKPARRSR
jgi:hypothetical protein